MSKKIVCMFLLFLLLPALIAASDVYEECRVFLDTSLPRCIPSVAQRSSGLTYQEKDLLYREYKKDCILPTILNGVIGLGIGSYVQSDMWGALIATALDSLSVALIFDPDTGNAFRPIGTIAICLSRIYQLVRPAMYASAYNKKLKEALYNGPQINLLPVIATEGDEIITSYTISAKITF